ncbi:DUF1515 family protein [Pelagibacterium montanilacus]|uniref:DUF1515 family protein n=1 Tax=Pelagibacterium montanilacus TaxID=2185280 RepID=UPI000F8D392C|nr:DUF1515 family protein [Pelagibacterium montanilacus]
MTEANNDRAIGRLEGKLDALIETVKSQGEKSDASRARLYDRVGSVERNTHELDSRMHTVEETVGKMRPLVDEFGRLKQRGVGMLMIIGFVWLLVGGLVVQGLGWVAAWAIRTLGGQ